MKSRQREKSDRIMRRQEVHKPIHDHVGHANSTDFGIKDDECQVRADDRPK